MNPNHTLELLARIADESVRIDLNDLAVNTLRDHSKAMGWTAADRACLLAEESARIPFGSDLVTYLRCVRAGSRFRLDRGARCAVFAVIATRRARPVGFPFAA